MLEMTAEGGVTLCFKESWASLETVFKLKFPFSVTGLLKSALF